MAERVIRLLASVLLVVTLNNKEVRTLELCRRTTLQQPTARWSPPKQRMPPITKCHPAKLGQFPHHALLVSDERVVCGGSLITKTTVLTVARCTVGYKKFSIRLGGVQRKQPENSTWTTVSSWADSHPNQDTDVAIVFLPEMAPFSSYIKPVALPSSVEVNDTFVGKTALITGFVKTSCSDNKPRPPIETTEKPFKGRKGTKWPRLKTKRTKKQRPPSKKTKKPTIKRTKKTRPPSKKTKKPRPTSKRTKKPHRPTKKTKKPRPTSKKTKKPKIKRTKKPRPTSKKTKKPRPTSKRTKKPRPPSKKTKKPRPPVETTKMPHPPIKTTKKPDPTITTKKPHPPVETTKMPHPPIKTTNNPDPTITTTTPQPHIKVTVENRDDGCALQYCQSESLDVWLEGAKWTALDCSGTLLWTEVEVIPNSACTTYYKPGVINENKLCAGISHSSICPGDDGSALVIHDAGGYKQIGVASFFPFGGCDAEIPAGYVRVTSILDWIIRKADAQA